MPETQKQRKPHWLFWILLGCLGFPVLVLYLFSERADSVRLPEELRRAPIALEPAGNEPPRRESPWVSKQIGLVPGVGFKDYESYLKTELARDPGLASATLYLQLSKQITDAKIDQAVRETFCRDSAMTLATERGEFSPVQMEWLRDHGDLLNQIQRFCKSGAMPALTARQRLDYQQRLKTMPPDPNFSLYWTSARLMIFKSQLHLQGGDYSAARQAAQDALQLAGMVRADESLIGHLVTVALAAMVCHALPSWLENPKIPQGEFAPFVESLDRFEATLNLPELNRRAIATSYLEMRSALLRELEKPTWRLPIYGWKRAEHPERYVTELALPFSRKHFQAPNLAEILIKSSLAIRNRQHAPEALKEYDRMNLKLIELQKLPFAQFVKEKQVLDQRIYSSSAPQYFLAQQTPNLEEVRRRCLMAETLLHLGRLGFGLRVDPAKLLAKQNDDLTSQPHHPWRDPFTDAPLQVDRPSSPTLIWSLGPDLKDQRGQMEYDPSNGTFSGGDIRLRLPAR
jgi:hypothetical protein